MSCLLIRNLGGWCARAIALLAFVVAAGITAGAAGDPSLSTTTLGQLRGPEALRGDYLRISLRYFGVYRVTGKEMREAGVDLAKIPPRKLALWNEGAMVPVHVKTAQPSKFADGDYIEFVGEPPRGTGPITFKPYNTHNIYLLNWTTEAPKHYASVRVKSTATSVPPCVFQEERFREEDVIFRRSALPAGKTDGFYWMIHQAGMKDTYAVWLSFPGFAREKGQPVRLKIRFFGLNEIPAQKPSHRFDMTYADQPIGGFGFSGIDYHTFETSIPAAQVKPDRQRIKLITPPDRQNAVDVVGLDSIEISYPRKLDAEGREMFRFNNRLLDAAGKTTMHLMGMAPGSVVFSLEERKLYEDESPTTGGSIPLAVGDIPTTFVAVAPEGICHVDSLEASPGNKDFIVASDTQALVLYHTKVAKSAEFYTAYRNSTGVKTVAFNAVDIYDRLNNGFIEDVPLKRFIRYVAGQAPSLKYLILFGDSIYDYRQTNYGAPADWDKAPFEILIPIHWLYSPGVTYTNGYPDDNWFGAFSTGNYPDVAVGRIPVNNEEQGFEYVRKIIEYEQLKKSRDDKALLISSVEASFQDLVMQTKKRFDDKFSTVTVLFPETKVATQEVTKLRDEINKGVQLLYYVGHGGTLVWRVGPVDFKQQKDLFTPREIETLTNSNHYPIVTCSSCYTTSFDNDLSIGESFVLQPKGGAIALIGTPWKSTVYEDHAFNDKFFGFYFDTTKQRLGDVFYATKTAMRRKGDSNQVDYQTFTLLGDPCLELERRD